MDWMYQGGLGARQAADKQTDAQPSSAASAAPSADQVCDSFKWIC